MQVFPLPLPLLPSLVLSSPTPSFPFPSFPLPSLFSLPSSPSPHLPLLTNLPLLRALDQELELEGWSYMVHCTSGDSRQAPWAALLSVCCPASSPRARAAGRGHFSSALLLPLVLLSCQIRISLNFFIPWFSMESLGGTFKNLHVQATL